MNGLKLFNEYTIDTGVLNWNIKCYKNDKGMAEIHWKCVCTTKGIWTK